MGAQMKKYSKVLFLPSTKAGKMMIPCKRPSTTMPKNILKNMRNISEAANAVTSIPRNVLNPVRKTEKIHCEDVRKNLFNVL